MLSKKLSQNVSPWNFYGNVNTSAANAPLSIGPIGFCVVQIMWSYSGTPTGGRLTVSTDGVTVIDLDITKGGIDSISCCLSGASTVTLAAGGAGVIGKLSFMNFLSGGMRTLSTSVPLSYKDTILADNPTLYMRLDEPSGASVVSQVGGYTGTISGGVTLNQSGAISGNAAMLFNGTTGKIATTLTSFPLPITIEAWIKTTQLSQGAVVNWAGAGTWTFGIINSGRLYAYSGTTGFTPSPNLQIADDVWHYIAVTISGTNRIFYIDGVQDYAVANADISMTGSTCSFAVEAPSTAWYGGLIDEVAIYSVVLTPTQIAAHYAAR